MEHNELAGHAGLFTYRFRGIGLQAAEIPNLVFAGTSVAQGNGRAMVIHTGMITKFDKIARLTQNVEDNVSPLQREFNHLPRQITIFALCIGVVFFILDVLFVHNPLAETFIFSLGMVVAFILEGLLPTVTRALAVAVQRMSKRNALVKKLSSVESLGSTSVICTDKTDTLTRNEMTVEYLWTLNHEYQVSGTGYAPKGEITIDGAVHHAADDAVLRELVTGGALCSNAHLHESEPDHDVRDDHMPLRQRPLASVWRSDRNRAAGAHHRSTDSADRVPHRTTELGRIPLPLLHPVRDSRHRRAPQIHLAASFPD